MRQGLALLLLLLSDVLLGRGAAQASPFDEALALIAAGRRDDARVALDSLLAVEALDPSERGEAAYQRALLEEEGAAFEARVLALLASGAAPAREARLRMALGHLAFARGDIEEALAAFAAAREHGLEEEGSLWEGLSALALGDGPAARAALDRAAGSGSSSIRQRARLALGDAQRLSGNWEAAIREYRRVRDDTRTGPEWWPTAAYHEADCLETLGKREEARKIFAEILDRAPASYEAPLAGIRLRAGSDLLVNEETPAEPAEAAKADTAAGAEPPPAPAERFTIQVGAFSVEENAQGLARDLARKGIADARVETRSDGLHRVLVGRFPGRAQAESAGDSLGAAFGLGFTVLALEED